MLSDLAASAVMLWLAAQPARATLAAEGAAAGSELVEAPSALAIGVLPQQRRTPEAGVETALMDL